MHTILNDIIEKKKLDLIEEKKKISLSSLRATCLPAGKLAKQSLLIESSLRLPRRSFLSLRNDGIFIIGEIKLASPTEKFLGKKEDIITRAIAYQDAGVDAISFITEKHYFNSDISFIPKIKEKVSLPILQKDFVIDAYQIYQAKKVGSDALLLIARLVDSETLKNFVLLCQKLEIEPVVEINTEEDLEKAIATNTKIIAVNARNLETFNVDVAGACDLLKKIPDRFFKLAFSGVKSSSGVKKYQDAGAQGVLVGTELMKAENIEEFISSLRGVKRRSNLDD